MTDISLPPRLQVVDDPQPFRVRRIEETLACSEFWRGAANMREAMFRQDRSLVTETGIEIARRMEAVPDLSSDSYRQWRSVAMYFERLRATRAAGGTA